MGGWHTWVLKAHRANPAGCFATCPTGHGLRLLGQSIIHFPEGGAEVKIVLP